MEDNQPVDVLLGTEPSDQELDMAREAGVKLVKVPICYDAFVFLVNRQNPVQSLTLDQIRDVYVGKVMNWSALGGEEQPILPFQREPNSGSQTAMENLVMKGVPMPAAMPNYVSDGMADLIAQIGDYDNGRGSLGYSYLYYLENLYPSGEVRPLSIDGIAPTAENLRNGKYPLTTCYYAVYREGEALGEAFAQWLSGPVGQQCVAQAGYVPYEE
jgi:phosphate transport system substrate-binding protein